jgi:hypothetical protein
VKLRDKIISAPSKIPWSTEQLLKVKGEDGYVGTQELIAWAKNKPEFRKRVVNFSKYKSSKSFTGYDQEHCAVAMEEIAHEMAMDAARKYLY